MAARWFVVANSSEFDGDGPFACQAEGLPLVLVRLNGALHAVEDRCPHMAQPLHRGRVEGGKLICSWHGWEFDLNAEQRWINPEMRCVPYPVRVREDGAIEVQFDPDALPAPPGGFPRDAN